MKQQFYKSLRITHVLIAFFVVAACAKKEQVRTASGPAKILNAGAEAPNVNPPHDLKVVGTGSLQVNLAWQSAGAGQQSQRLERSQDKNAWQSLQNLDPSVAEATDNAALEAATLYYYRVLAIYENGTAPSNVVAVLTPDGNGAVIPTQTATNVPSATPTDIPVATPTPTDVVVATPTPVDAPVTTVTSFSPQTGPVGTVVTVVGTNLMQATYINMNGFQISVTPTSDTSLTFTIPNGATTGVYALSTPRGYVNLGNVFYLPQVIPSISSFSPTSGPVGTIVTLTGPNLGIVNQAYMGGTPMTMVTRGDDWLTFQIPPGTSSNYISIQRDIGTFTTTSMFTVTGP